MAELAWAPAWPPGASRAGACAKDARISWRTFSSLASIACTFRLRSPITTLASDRGASDCSADFCCELTEHCGYKYCSCAYSTNSQSNSTLILFPALLLGLNCFTLHVSIAAQPRRQITLSPSWIFTLQHCEARDSGTPVLVIWVVISVIGWLLLLTSIRPHSAKSEVLTSTKNQCENKHKQYYLEDRFIQQHELRKRNLGYVTNTII